MIAGRRAAVAAGALLVGTLLRVLAWDSWPPGPYLDETDFVRNAREWARGATWPTGESFPLQPAEAGFVSNYATDGYLALVAALDRAAGGGLASIRVQSILPALALLGAGLALAAGTCRDRPGAFPIAALLLATATPLLVAGRWACDPTAAAALTTLAGAAAWRAASRDSIAWAAAAGLAAGLGTWIYAAPRLALVGLGLFLAWTLARRDARNARLGAAALVAAVVTVSPLAARAASRPERAFARTDELAVWRRPPAAALAALGANVRDYAALFLLRGDANERHGDPARPILPALVTGAALVGLAGARRPGAERFLAAGAATFLAGGLLARNSPLDANGANAVRIGAAIPFLVVLAGLGAARLVASLPRARRRAGGWLVAGAVCVTGAFEVGAFADWGASPRTWGALGGPERELADAIARSRLPGDAVLLGPGAARAPHVVDVLLQAPRDPRHAVRVASLDAPAGWAFRPEGGVLYAAGDERAADAVATRLAGTRVAVGRDPEGRVWWVLLRLAASAARAEAEAALSVHPLEPERPGGNWRAPEEGLYRFSAGPGIRARLDGVRLGGPGGDVSIRLASGDHRLTVDARPVGAAFVVRHPDGFARRL